MPTLININYKKLPNWQDIVGKVIQLDNDHAFKFVYTCIKESKFYKDDIYKYAASLKAGF